MRSGAGNVPYGTAPWHQSSWDARAAGNFIGGGLGSGLVVVTALFGATHAPALLLGGVVLVALGLASVALELGRPLRALNVFRNPRTSWMSREAIAGAVLSAAALGAAAGVPGCGLLALIAAVAFMFCQARLLQGARGIPAWRERTMVPLLIATALTEGAGLFVLAGAVMGFASAPALTAFAALVIVRAIVWRVYRQRITSVAPRANLALEAAGRILVLGGTAAPIVLIALAVMAPGASAPLLVALAGAAGAAAGGVLKFAIVTRAGFNQGFKLAELPVRGARP